MNMGKTLNEFRMIRDTMLWKESAIQQIDAFAALGARLGIAYEVVSTHQSKSILLPVVQFDVSGVGRFTLRDNFYDTNVCADLVSGCNLSLKAFFAGMLQPRDWQWYLGEIKRKREYCWQHWTDEEMDDPKILSIDQPYEISVQPDEKYRWLKRMTDPEWYHRDWSAAQLTWEGPFGPGVEIYPQRHAFAEGINTEGADPIYTPGAKNFLIALDSIERAGDMIIRISRSIKDY